MVVHGNPQLRDQLETLNFSTKTQFLHHNKGEIAFDFTPSQEQCQELLVLINGFQRSRGDYRAIRKKIKDELPHLATLSLDNRGVGETVNHLNRFDTETMAMDVKALAHIYMKKLGLSQYSALGISMGGMIAQCLAADDAALERLILVSTTAGGAARTWPEETNHETKFEFRDWQDSETSIRQNMARYFAPSFLKKSPYLIDMMVKQMLKGAKDQKRKDGSRAQFNASAKFDGSHLAHQISAKTLVITGSEDRIIPPENAMYLAQFIPNAELKEYEDVGHLILMEAPERFRQDIKQFLGA